MPRIRVLVVDDSSLARQMLTEYLSSDEDIEVVGTARNGREAVEMVRDLKPDIATMDIEMPVLDGIGAIEEIMSRWALPILVVTSRNDEQTAYDAIASGALDLIGKPTLAPRAAAELVERVKLLSRVRVFPHVGRWRERMSEALPPVAAGDGNRRNRVVAIAASTGGPPALADILCALPSPFPCPIVIAQHLSDGFAPSMTQWMAKRTRHRVVLVERESTLRPGRVYLSPSERHAILTPGPRVSLKERAASDIYYPSCDALLASAAHVYGAGCIGVILTGIGEDGAAGMAEIHRRGGVTIAQDESTCVVFGMPHAAIDAECVDFVLPVGQIAGSILRALDLPVRDTPTRDRR